MNRLMACRCAAACLVLAQGATAARAKGDAAPYETVRVLESLEDQIAGGDMVAQAAHDKEILRAARLFAGARAAVWSDRRNARALVIYLFSGGDAKVIAAAVPREAIAPGVQALYDGAVAYGLGDDAGARAALMPIDAKTQTGSVGGHLALVQAILAAGDDRSKAIALLDLARLLEPGTLVEEAALRKEMSLIGASGDLDKFALLTRRYLGAFSHSSYADNFRQLVAETAMQIGADDTAEAGARLARLMTGLGPTERLRLYLAIAHAAVLAGRTTMATQASEEARKLVREEQPEASRALVYYGAAAIVGARYDLAKKALADASAERLTAADRALRTSALGVADAIRSPAEDQQRAGAAGSEAALSADADRSLRLADAALQAAGK